MIFDKLIKSFALVFVAAFVGCTDFADDAAEAYSDYLALHIHDDDFVPALQESSSGHDISDSLYESYGTETGVSSSVGNVESSAGGAVVSSGNIIISSSSQIFVNSSNDILSSETIVQSSSSNGLEKCDGFEGDVWYSEGSDSLLFVENGKATEFYYYKISNPNNRISLNQYNEICIEYESVKSSGNKMVYLGVEYEGYYYKTLSLTESFIVFSIDAALDGCKTSEKDCSSVARVRIKSNVNYFASQNVKITKIKVRDYSIFNSSELPQSSSSSSFNINSSEDDGGSQCDFYRGKNDAALESVAIMLNGSISSYIHPIKLSADSPISNVADSLINTFKTCYLNKSDFEIVDDGNGTIENVNQTFRDACYTSKKINVLVKKDVYDCISYYQIYDEGKNETPTFSYPTLTDNRDNRDYDTFFSSLCYGNSECGKKDTVWMTYNLNFAKKDSRCYQNAIDSCEAHGRLYDWESAKKACPDGWHLPTRDEYEKLMNSSSINDFLPSSPNSGRAYMSGIYEWSTHSFVDWKKSGRLWWLQTGNEKDSVAYAFKTGLDDSGYDNIEFQKDTLIDKRNLLPVRCIREIENF
ncbi:MAG: hypothetical protein MJY82_03155 [Fibrobacter sp.]|nr:hypothetical protein [Fibrobacter sp.]